MEKKQDKTPKAGDVKKKLEALVGHRIEASVEELIRLVFAVGAFAFKDGNVTSRSIFFPSKTCSSGRLLDASGVSSTGTDGNRVFLLSDFVRVPQYTRIRHTA